MTECQDTKILRLRYSKWIISSLTRCRSSKRKWSQLMRRTTWMKITRISSQKFATTKKLTISLGSRHIPFLVSFKRKPTTPNGQHSSSTNIKIQWGLLLTRPSQSRRSSSSLSSTKLSLTLMFSGRKRKANLSSWWKPWTIRRKLNSSSGLLNISLVLEPSTTNVTT